MNEEALGWFHCGRCGHLFQSPLDDDGRICEKCGQNPSTFGEAPQPTKAVHPTQSPQPENSPSPGVVESALPQKRSVRKRRENPLVFKIVVAWLVLVMLFALAARHFWKEDDRLGTQVRAPINPPNELGDEERAILEDALPQCSQSLGGFLASSAPEQRNQYVWRPISVAGKMARFYAMNPLLQVTPTDVKIIERRLLKLETGLAIVSEWEVVDGRKLDAVFHKEDGEWRLDWEQFVRNGDQPWPLFLAGNGGEVGEFRLMARLKLNDEKLRSDQLSLVLYSPRFGYPWDPGNASPEFLIPRSSDNGRLLAAAFNARKSGKSPFDGSIKNFDPEEMIRIRVRIRRQADNKGRVFTIEKVIACHWLAIDEPGLAPLSEEQAAEEEAAIKNPVQPPLPEE